MALTLSVGFVVDDAIVMLENIVRHMEMGEGPMQAALRGSREIGFTIVSMTISLAAVFLPFLFMGGIVGRLLHEFAVTIAVAILVSGFVSLSLTPMMCSRLLKSNGHSKEVKHGRMYMMLERFFDGLLKGYDHSLQFVIRHKLATMALFVILAGATVYLFRTMPTGFLPSEDQGQLYAATEAAQGVSFQDMVDHQVAVSKAVLNTPEGKYINSFMSIAGRGASNAGMMVMRFVPRSERPHVDEIMQRLRPQLAKVPGISVYLQNPPPIRIGGQLTKSQYQFTIQGPDTDQLYQYAPKLEEEMKKLPGLQDVTSDLQLKNPEVDIDIDRDKAAALGISAQQVEDALYTAYGSRQISTIYAPNNAYRVIMELQPQYQLDPAALSIHFVLSSHCSPRRISALVTDSPENVFSRNQ
jgi:HAE1 family hydrophobic/amphiphilic exporter-1